MLHIQHNVNLGMLTQMERIAKINGLDRLDKNIVQQHRQSLVSAAVTKVAGVMPINCEKSVPNNYEGIRITRFDSLLS
jgi:hypothetical protein